MIIWHLNVTIANVISIGVSSGGQSFTKILFSLAFLVFTIKKETEKQWDGIVIDKRKALRLERSSSDEDSNYTS